MRVVAVRSVEVEYWLLLLLFGPLTRFDAALYLRTIEGHLFADGIGCYRRTTANSRGSDGGKDECGFARPPIQARGRCKADEWVGSGGRSGGVKVKRARERATCWGGGARRNLLHGNRGRETVSSGVVLRV